jgi:hypothetical protein
MFGVECLEETPERLIVRKHPGQLVASWFGFAVGGLLLGTGGVVSILAGGEWVTRLGMMGGAALILGAIVTLVSALAFWHGKKKVVFDRKKRSVTLSSGDVSYSRFLAVARDTRLVRTTDSQGRSRMRERPALCLILQSDMGAQLLETLLGRSEVARHILDELSTSEIRANFSGLDIALHESTYRVQNMAETIAKEMQLPLLDLTAEYGAITAISHEEL